METTKKIEGTNNSPFALFDFEKGELKIKGHSYPEHPIPFYEELTRNLSSFLTDSIKLTINLEYVNTASSKCLLHLLKEVQEKFPGSSILWIYEQDDEDLEDMGMIFEDSLDMPFEFRVTV